MPSFQILDISKFYVYLHYIATSFRTFRLRPSSLQPAEEGAPKRNQSRIHGRVPRVMGKCSSPPAQGQEFEHGWIQSTEELELIPIFKYLDFQIMQRSQIYSI